jgi:hypothetical protein
VTAAIDATKTSGITPLHWPYSPALAVFLCPSILFLEIFTACDIILTGLFLLNCMILRLIILFLIILI